MIGTGKIHGVTADEFLQMTAVSFMEDDDEP